MLNNYAYCKPIDSYINSIPVFQTPIPIKILYFSILCFTPLFLSYSYVFSDSYVLHSSVPNRPLMVLVAVVTLLLFLSMWLALKQCVTVAWPVQAALAASDLWVDVDHTAARGVDVNVERTPFFATEWMIPAIRQDNSVTHVGSGSVVSRQFFFFFLIFFLKYL